MIGNSFIQILYEIIKNFSVSNRMKREKREEIVRKGVVEHERLEQQFDKKEKELRRQYEELQKRFEEERMKVGRSFLCFYYYYYYFIIK